MKIALFHNLPSGGAKRALYGFTKYLKRKGHSIRLFVPSTADEDFLNLADFAESNIQVPVQKTFTGILQSSIRYLLPLRFSAADLEKAEAKLAEEINRTDSDVVFVEQDRFTMSPFLLKFLKKPHVYYCPQPSRLNETIRKLQLPKVGNVFTGWWHQYLEKRIPELDRRNCSFAKRILTNSYFSREAILRSYGMNASVCYLGVDTEIFHPLELQREEYLLTVGSFGPLKGYDFLIRSLARISPATRPPWIVVSNSVNERYFRAMKAYAREYEVHLELRRMINDTDLVRLYNQARMLIYAPYLEPFGLAVLEAMACGTPVVAVREGGIQESISQNETGLLTERDEEAFAGAVLSLLQNRDLADKISAQARIAARGFWSLDQATERLLEQLHRSVSEQSQGP